MVHRRPHGAANGGMLPQRNENNRDLDLPCSLETLGLLVDDHLSESFSDSCARCGYLLWRLICGTLQ